MANPWAHQTKTLGAAHPGDGSDHPSDGRQQCVCERTGKIIGCSVAAVLAATSIVFSVSTSSRVVSQDGLGLQLPQTMSAPQPSPSLSSLSPLAQSPPLPLLPPPPMPPPPSPIPPPALLQSLPSTISWISYPHANCFVGHGRSRTDPTPSLGHLGQDLETCKANCVAYEGCTAITTAAGMACNGHASVHIPDCTHSPTWSSYVIADPAPPASPSPPPLPPITPSPP